MGPADVRATLGPKHISKVLQTEYISISYLPILHNFVDFDVIHDRSTIIKRLPNIL